MELPRSKLEAPLPSCLFYFQEDARFHELLVVMTSVCFQLQTVENYKVDT